MQCCCANYYGVCVDQAATRRRGDARTAGTAGACVSGKSTEANADGIERVIGVGVGLEGKSGATYAGGPARAQSRIGYGGIEDFMVERCLC